MTDTEPIPTKVKTMKELITLLALLVLTVSCSSGGDDTPIMSGGPEGIIKEELERTKKVTTSPSIPTTPTVTTPVGTSSYPSITSSSGILWKPVADSGGGLVVLLHRSYGNPGVAVLSVSGTVIETGRFVYYSNPDRATYRFSRPGASFPTPCLLKVGTKIYKVDDPRRRYE